MSAPRHSSRSNTLTATEIDHLVMAAQGLSSKEAARVLGVSWHTVKDTWKRACARLDARNTTHAVAIAAARGVITLEQVDQ